MKLDKFGLIAEHSLEIKKPVM